MTNETGSSVPTSDPTSGGHRRASWWYLAAVLGVVVIAVVVILIVVNSDDSDDAGSASSTSTSVAAAATTTTATTATTSAPATTAPSTAPAGPQVKLTTSFGGDTTFVVTSCDNPGDTTITLRAETLDDEPLVLDLETRGGEGTITLSGADEAEGTVDEIVVSDEGAITASGPITPADDSAMTGTWQLTGNCA